MKFSSGLLLILLFVANVRAQSRLAIDNEKSSLIVYGTSNVHDWELNAETLKGKVDLSKNDKRVNEIKSLEVSINVTGLKSGKSGMDKNTFKALKSEEFPMIKYSLSKVYSINPSKDGKGYIVTADGNMTIAGKTNTEKMKVYSIVNPDGSVRFSGTVTFPGTKYGVEPVTALMGSIKTGDEVKIKFNVIFN